MMKLLEYILKRGSKVKVSAIPAPTALYVLDKDLEKTPSDVRLAQDVTTDNP